MVEYLQIGIEPQTRVSLYLLGWVRTQVPGCRLRECAFPAPSVGTALRRGESDRFCSRAQEKSRENLYQFRNGTRRKDRSLAVLALGLRNRPSSLWTLRC